MKKICKKRKTFAFCLSLPKLKDASLLRAMGGVFSVIICYQAHQKSITMIDKLHLFLK